MNRSIQKILFGLLLLSCSHLMLGVCCYENKAKGDSPKDHLPNSETDKVPPGNGGSKSCCGNQAGSSSEGHLPTPDINKIHSGGVIFVKGDCGDDEETCIAPGEPGHGCYEMMVEPGVALSEGIKMLQEKEKQRVEKVKQELEEYRKQISEQREKNQELVKEQQEHDLKFKNGKIFIPSYRNGALKEVKSYFEFIKEYVQEVDAKTPLDEEYNQDISNILKDINRELKGIQEEIGGIEKCLSLPEKSPRINYEQEAKNLNLAKGMVKDLEGYKEALCNLLAARRKELNNPELEAAYKEVEQRKNTSN
jgi:cellobiose-specific phosphotransferase system component IIA